MAFEIIANVVERCDAAKWVFRCNCKIKHLWSWWFAHETTTALQAIGSERRPPSPKTV